MFLDASHRGAAKTKCKITPKQRRYCKKILLLTKANMYHPSLHPKWSTASVIQKIKGKREKKKKKVQKLCFFNVPLKGFPYNDQSLEKNSGHLAQSHICHVHCFSVIIQLCLFPLGCSSQLPGLQTSIHDPREGTTCCQPGLVTDLDTTQSSGSAFSSVFYRILEQAQF